MVFKILDLQNLLYYYVSLSNIQIACTIFISNLLNILKKLSKFGIYVKNLKFMKKNLKYESQFG